MLLWQVAERGAHQEGQPSMAGGDLVLWPLWKEDETISRSNQGNVVFSKVEIHFVGPCASRRALSALGAYSACAIAGQRHG